MDTTVSVEDKKIFIRWFLKNYKLKRRECVWILNYVLGHEQYLENIHFVEEASLCPRAMEMSATGMENDAFLFYLGNLMGVDAEKAFHDLKLHPENKMYIQLNFPNKSESMQYQNVVEENKFNPFEIQPTSTITLETEDLINDIMKNTNRRSILDEIDKALDRGDKELFMELSGMLNRLGKESVGAEKKKTISFSA